MLKDLMARLWADDVGSVIASEYLMLGSIVSLGSVAGLSAMRDAANTEMQEFGETVRVVNRGYRENVQRHMQRQTRSRQAPRQGSSGGSAYSGLPVDDHQEDIRFMNP